MKQIRLDKYLAEISVGTRSKVKELVKKGRITVNGNLCRTPDFKVDTSKDQVALDGKVLGYSEYEYYMLNKPAGVVSATEDNIFTTVIELIKESKRKDLFPVGRLDKDTEGLLIITNDGELAHNLLSPKKHVNKTYYAKVQGRVTDKDIKTFAEGMKVDEELTAMPAELKIITSKEISEIELTIKEGKFHQVKRMFMAIGMEVLYLKRLSMGTLILDEMLKPGEYRPLTEKEILNLKNEGQRI